MGGQERDDRDRQHDGRGLPEQQGITFRQRFEALPEIGGVRVAKVEQKLGQAFVTLVRVRMDCLLQGTVDPRRDLALIVEG